MQDPELSTTKLSEQKELEVEAIDFFVRMMGILGLPRSVGEIYGLLYFSEVPQSMEDISTRFSYLGLILPQKIQQQADYS